MTKARTERGGRGRWALRAGFQYDTRSRRFAARKAVLVRSTIACLPLILLALLACACERKADPKPAGSAGGPASSASEKPLRIAVAPKGTTHEFWKSVKAGAERAAKAAGNVEITFRGPEREDDREAQISLVQNLIAAKYDAIVLAPLDDQALVGPVKQATAAGIPVVIIDSGLKAEAGKDFVSFVATDNYLGGKLAGKRLAEAMGGKGKAMLLRYLEGSASTAQREQGFIDAIKEAGGIELIDPKRYAGATRATAQEAADNLIASNQGFTGVFCPNEPSTFGMVLALRNRSLLGKVAFVGFDASDAALEALRNGEMQGLVLQNPIRMGEMGVRAAVDHLRKKPVERLIDTGVRLVTKENLQTPETLELIGAAPVPPTAPAKAPGGP